METLELNKIYNMDCMEGMERIPDGSIDLILCDPPYGTVKGLNIDAWKNQTTEWDTAIPPKDIYESANRILRMNGALILFSQEPYTSKLINEAHNNVPFGYRCIWLKDHFANPLGCKKAPVSYFEDIVVFFKKYDTLAQHPLREYSKLIMEFIGLGLKEINKDLGHRKAEHFFYTESTQFALCTKDVYEEIVLKYKINLQQWFMEFEELEKLTASLTASLTLKVDISKAMC